MTTRPAQAVLTPPRMSRKGGWIEKWEPEDAAFWDGGGARIARRNLVFSILCEHVGFSVWLKVSERGATSRPFVLRR